MMATGQRRSALDPAVATIITDAQQQQRDRRRSKAKREKARRDRDRQRAIYDVPQVVREQVERVAAGEQMSASAVAALLLAYGLRQLEQGAISLAHLKVPSASPAYEYRVETATVLAVLRGERTPEAGRW